jgi:hypothetical protein
MLKGINKIIVNFYICLHIYAIVASKSLSILIFCFEKTMSVCNVLMFGLQCVAKYVLLCN